MVSGKPIGIFDSGFGGLTVARSIIKQLPQYDYIYLGDSARAPYGNRSFKTIHQYTWECVQWLFKQGCPLVILACNTASAKALRTIQQQDLPVHPSAGRVLGVIRPTAEVIGTYTLSNHIGVLGTTGTVQSGSYLMEIARFFSDLRVHQQACPLWVPLIESGGYEVPGAGRYIRPYLDELMQRSPDIDTILLACTHYPLLADQIKACLPAHVKVVAQGGIVAASLAGYLIRHPALESGLSRQASRAFFTTMTDTAVFDTHASRFFGEEVKSEYADVQAKC